MHWPPPPAAGAFTMEASQLIRRQVGGRRRAVGFAAPLNEVAAGDARPSECPTQGRTDSGVHCRRCGAKQAATAHWL